MKSSGKENKILIFSLHLAICILQLAISILEIAACSLRWLVYVFQFQFSISVNFSPVLFGFVCLMSVGYCLFYVLRVCSCNVVYLEFHFDLKSLVRFEGQCKFKFQFQLLFLIVAGDGW